MAHSFEWDELKNLENQRRHSISFEEAQYAFADLNRIILKDTRHTTPFEKRYYCVGKIEEGIITVRYTYRNKIIRIFGAGFWRKFKRIYLEKNNEKNNRK